MLSIFLVHIIQKWKSGPSYQAALPLAINIGVSWHSLLPWSGRLNCPYTRFLLKNACWGSHSLAVQYVSVSPPFPWIGVLIWRCLLLLLLKGVSSKWFLCACILRASSPAFRKRTLYTKEFSLWFSPLYHTSLCRICWKELECGIKLHLLGNLCPGGQEQRMSFNTP